MLSNYNPQFDVEDKEFNGSRNHNPSINYSLDEILSNLSPKPSYAGLLGIMNDGTPLLFDLSIPKVGGVLVIGSNIFETNNILDQIVVSLIKLNDPNWVNLHRIQSDRGSYDPLTTFPQIRQSFSPFSKESCILIEELINLFEDRRNGMPKNPTQLLLIENVATVISTLPLELKSSFEKLIFHGPEENIWVFAGIPEKETSTETLKILNSFETLLIGNVMLTPHLTRLNNFAPDEFSRIIPGKECYVHSDEETLFVNLLKT